MSNASRSTYKHPLVPRRPFYFVSFFVSHSIITIPWRLGDSYKQNTLLTLFISIKKKKKNPISLSFRICFFLRHYWKKKKTGKQKKKLKWRPEIPESVSETSFFGFCLLALASSYIRLHILRRNAWSFSPLKIGEKKKKKEAQCSRPVFSDQLLTTTNKSTKKNEPDWAKSARTESLIYSFFFFNWSSFQISGNGQDSCATRFDTTA